MWALAQASTVMECDHKVWQKQIIHAPEASLFFSVNFKLSSLVYVLEISELAMYVRMAHNLQPVSEVLISQAYDTSCFFCCWWWL